MMEPDEHAPVLDFSDVVHDGSLDSDEEILHDSSLDVSDPRHPPGSSPHHRPQSPHHHHSLLSPSPSIPDQFSVEMLEREIATLLHQNASAASAALLSAAAQQRQAQALPGHHHLDHADQQQQPDDHTQEHARGDGHDVDDTGAGLPDLGLDLSGIAAMLHAAHARAASNGRHLEAAKDHRMQQMDAERRTTRSAPAFHSLTAGEHDGYVVDSALESSNEDLDMLYPRTPGDHDGHESERAMEDDGRSPSRRIHTDPSSPDAHSTAPGEFTDISDILNHLTSHFEADAATHASLADGASPVSHASPPPCSRTPGPSRVCSQPIASTSSPSRKGTLEHKKAKKRGEKEVEKEKDKAPSVHTCQDPQCRKSFTRRSDLARHTRIHTGERPFLCDHGGCGKTFIQRSALHVHQRVHTGEKPHSCEYSGCGKMFGDSSSLARHRRTHTGKRPYKCEDPECEKTFTRRTTLTQHMRTHDPAWEPDPNIKYNLKTKKQKMDDPQLEASVRTISALFSPTGSLDYGAVPRPVPDGQLEATVASISAEIAAAIAQASSRVLQMDEDGLEEEEEGEEEEEEEEEGEEEGGDGWGSGPELVRHARTVAKTSGIRGEGEEEEDSDTFPIPLRTRKGKEAGSGSVSGSGVGTKRKR